MSSPWSVLLQVRLFGIHLELATLVRSMWLINLVYLEGTGTQAPLPISDNSLDRPKRERRLSEQNQPCTKAKRAVKLERYL